MYFQDYLVARVLDGIWVLLIRCAQVSLEFRANLSGERGPTMITVSGREPGSSHSGGASCLDNGRWYVPQTNRRSGPSVISRSQLTFCDHEVRI